MRTLLASFRLAFASLLRSKLRSALTSLGILIGIAAVVVVTALATGARERIGGQIESLGSNLIFIWSQPVTKSGARAQSGSVQGLTDRDAEAIRRGSSAVSGVAVYSEVKMQLVSQFANARTGVMGVDQDYMPVRGYEVANGRMWTPTEEQSKAKVALIGKTAATNLFGNIDPVGRWVRVGRYPFRIVGTLVPKGQSPFEDQDDRLLIPIGAWRTRVSPMLGDGVQLIIASAKSAAHNDRAQRQIEAILRQRHGIAEGDEDDFRVRTQAAFKEQQDRIYGILTALLVSVAGISLFVGGVGVMNIMLVNVAERTREIGIRMAIGASRGDIQAQFLTEAVALTMFGGAAGLSLAVGIIVLLERTLGWTMRLSPEAVLVAVLTSTAVGLLFGFLPARRAATLDPIDALRQE